MKKIERKYLIKSQSVFNDMIIEKFICINCGMFDFTTDFKLAVRYYTINNAATIIDRLQEHFPDIKFDIYEL